MPDAGELGRTPAAVHSGLKTRTHHQELGSPNEFLVASGSSQWSVAAVPAPCSLPCFALALMFSISTITEKAMAAYV